MFKNFFIPGLGSSKTIDKQVRYIAFLNKHLHKSIYFFDPLWETNEEPDVKVTRMRHAYNEAGKPGKITGISAGAALSILLAAESSAKLLTIAGKHKGTETIGIAFQKRAPALLKIVAQSKHILATNDSVAPRLTSYRPIFYDGIIPMHDITVQGACNKFIPIPFHIPVVIIGLVTVVPFK
jgi:hypothetical protein